MMWKNTVEPDKPRDENMAHALCVLDKEGIASLFFYRCTVHFELYVVHTLTNKSTVY